MPPPLYIHSYLNKRLVRFEVDGSNFERNTKRKIFGSLFECKQPTSLYNPGFDKKSFAIIRNMEL